MIAGQNNGPVTNGAVALVGRFVADNNDPCVPGMTQEHRDMLIVASSPDQFVDIATGFHVFFGGHPIDAGAVRRSPPMGTPLE